MSITTRSRVACMSAGILAFVCAMPTAEAQRTVSARTPESDEQHALDVLLARTVSVDLHAVSLRDAVDAVAASARVRVQYDASALRRYSNAVTLRLDNVSLGAALDRLTRGTRLQVGMDGPNYLTITESDSGAHADSVTGIIVGRVVDSATGRSLNGVTIKVAGTKLSAITADSGRFTMRDVPIGDQTLIAKVFGYHPETRAVSVTAHDRVMLRLTMTQSPNVLTGVVTTATGVQDRKTVGQDITVLNVDSVLRTAPIKNLTDLLDGRVPGLTVQHTSGVPGAPARLRFRGITGGLVPGSNRSNDPILIVDGIRQFAESSTPRSMNGAASGYTAPSGFDQLDVNNFETVELLKGPSASALYGPDAANGVIVVTTKKGHAGKPHFDAATSYGINYMPGVYAQPGYYQFGHDQLDGGPSTLCGGIGDVYTSDDLYGSGTHCFRDSLRVFQALDIPRLSSFGIGTQNDATASVSGGSGTTTYAMTGTTQRALGYLKMPELYQDQYREYYRRDIPTWMRRPNGNSTTSGNLKLDIAPYAGLQLSLSTGIFTDDQHQSSAQGTLSELAGTYIDTTALQAATLGQYTTRVNSHTVTTNMAGSLAWQKWSWLPVMADLGTSVSDREGQSLVPYGYLGISGHQEDTLGYFSYARLVVRTQSVNVRSQVFQNGLVTANVGVNYTREEPKSFSGITNALQAGVNTPATFTTAGQNDASKTTAGWFAEPRFRIGNTYIGPGFRIDNTGSYRSKGLAGGNGWLAALLPHLDFSWIAVNREDGERPALGFLTLLRPRMAFGVSGIQPDPTQLLRAYTIGSQLLATGGECDPANIATTDCYLGIRLRSVGNPDLRPERSRELEYGFDADLWGSRLQLKVSGARKLTLDQIVQAPTAPSAGGASLLQFRNLGDVRNVSTDVQIIATPIQTASTTFTVDAIVSATRNTVLRVNGTQQKLSMGNGVFIVPGYPIDGRWDRPIVGYRAPANGKKLGATDVFLGDSVEYLGSALAKYTLPVSSTLSLWRDLVSLSASVHYEHGLTQFGSGNRQLLMNLYLDSSASLGQQAAALAAYCQANYAVGGPCNASATLAGLVQTVNVLRLQSISLSYNVPSRVTRRFGAPHVRLQLQGQNVGLWTNYHGKDPDVNGTPVGEAIEDSGQEPLARSWSVGIQVGN